MNIEEIEDAIKELSAEELAAFRAWFAEFNVDEEPLASLDRGLADIAAGRVNSLDEYERERGL
jgi:predicted transcriptional regulator